MPTPSITRGLRALALGVMVLAFGGLCLWILNGGPTRRGHSALVSVMPKGGTSETTNGTIYWFVITNGVDGHLLGFCHLEVLDGPTWFNARPQPQFSYGTFLELAPGETLVVNCPAPTDRAEEGHVARPGEPPGQRWRLAFDFMVNRQPSGMLGQCLEQIRGWLPRRSRQAFGPEIPFAVAPSKE